MLKGILPLLFLYFISLACFSQNSDSLPEELLDETFGVEKLILLNQLSKNYLNENTLESVRNLAEVAKRRNQSLAQMALAWVLRDPRITSALIGASRISQLEENVQALSNLSFSTEELAEIDKWANDAGLNIWVESSTAG